MTPKIRKPIASETAARGSFPATLANCSMAAVTLSMGFKPGSEVAMCVPFDLPALGFDFRDR
mgnify:CR=1 FL=1